MPSNSLYNDDTRPYPRLPRRSIPRKDTWLEDVLIVLAYVSLLWFVGIILLVGWYVLMYASTMAGLH